ncbi:unnamed protein product [Calicophoron daubneyi]|uniref:Nuclear nucleic acid-binding protein C1D n=1 Tax=Calicophoron daubneyi TaxID=300641 RepID=A0AAV2T5M0_CALDB
MSETSIFDEIPEEISQHLVSFSEIINGIGDFVDSYTGSVGHPGGSSESDSSLSKIKSELSLCYTFNALFFVYLRCIGVDTTQHPVMQELDRVMTALKRCRALTEKNATPHLRTDKEAASRFIKHALWQSAHSKAKKRRADAGDGSSK